MGAIILVLLVVAIHLYIALLEMVMWESPRSRKIFGNTPEFAAQTKMLALNQGLYNLFLAVGLLFGLWAGGTPMVAFLLICVGVAGVVALMCGLTRAFVFQTIPAVAALAALWLT